MCKLCCIICLFAGFYVFLKVTVPKKKAGIERNHNFFEKKLDKKEKA